MKKMNNEEFVERAIIIHGNKYSYLNVLYENSHTKVKILCPNHGEFEQRAASHLRGIGCSKCGGSSKATASEFVEKSKLLHGDKYDYSEVIYFNSGTKVELKCQIHGQFKIRPESHLTGGGCRICAINKKRKTNEEFVKEAMDIHNDKYSYTNLDYVNSFTKIEIFCPVDNHGFFAQIPPAHLRGSGCPKCNDSIGEKSITKYLKNKNIVYVSQYKFNECKNKKSLPFDFYLSDLNICIEYDGEQHFKPIKKFGGEKSFLKTKNNDEIKNKYCKDKNIKLIRIKYTEFKNINKILDEQLNVGELNG